MLRRRLQQYGGLLTLARERAMIAAGPRPRIAYLGAQGFGNLGDDAMWEAVQRLIPRCKLIPFTSPYWEARLARAGLSGPAYFSSAILGGGTLINPFWTEITQLATSLGIPLWSVGTGVGSCGFEQPDGVSIQEWRPLLARFRRIGVRGPRSRAALAAIGISDVEVTGDLALSLAREQPTPLLPTPRFAVNLAVEPGRQPNSVDLPVLQQTRDAVLHLVTGGWQPVPIALHPRDVAPTQQLMAQVSRGDVPVPVLRTAEQFFQAVGSCAFTVAVRLHGAVLSCCVGVPPLMLGYRDKCLDFMLSMDLEEWYVDLETATSTEIQQKVSRLSERTAALRPEVLARARAWKQKIEGYVHSAIPETRRASGRQRPACLGETPSKGAGLTPAEVSSKSFPG